MKHLFFSILITLLLLPALKLSAAGGDSLSVFTKLLAESNMEFAMPEGLVEAVPVANVQMNYEYVARYPDKKFEVRYAIRPLNKRVEQYKVNCENQKPGEHFVDPNLMYKQSFVAVAMNISGMKYSGNKEFNKESVSKEFNADWGATTFVETEKSFGQGYTYCMMIALHKDNCADAYVFFMTDDKQKLMALAMPAFHSLKFKL